MLDALNAGGQSSQRQAEPVERGPVEPTKPLYEWVWLLVEQKAEESGRTPQDVMDSALEEASRIVEAHRREVEMKNRATVKRLTVELDEHRAEIKRLTDKYESHNRQSAPNTLASTEEQFVSKADEVPDNAMEDGIKNINSQIQAIAITVSHSVNLQTVFNKKKRKALLAKESFTNLRSIIGAKLLDVLTKVDYVEDQIFVQLCMQAIMCFFVARICEIWPFSPTRKASSGKGIWFVYKDMHKQELQAVSARWRSLGAKYSRPKGHVEELQQEMVRATVQYISRVMMVAGVSEDQNKVTKYIESCVGDRLRTMWTAATQFAERMREHVFSTDYIVLSFFPQSDLDPSCMTVEGVGDDEGTREGKILCTTQLGLKRETNVSTPEEKIANPIKTDVVLKTVVVLEDEFGMKMKG